MTDRAFAADESSSKTYFAGFAFLSKDADIGTRFPHLQAALSGSRAASFDQRLVYQGRQSRQTGPIVLEFEQLGVIHPGNDANVLALAFDGELSFSNQIRNDWLLVVELSFQVLIFDYASKQIRASFPFTAEYNDVLQDPPTPQDIDQAVERLALGDQATGVVANFWSKADALKLPALGARTLRVVEVAISDAVLQVASSDGIINAEALKDQLGHDFSGFLSQNQGVPVLPFASNQAIANKMAARMSDGTIFNLKIPSPDYEIRLRLDGLKKVLAASTAAGSSWVFGAFITITVIEPLSGRKYFEDQVKLGAARTEPASERASSDDWPAYFEAIRNLFNQFTQALSGPNRAWAEKHLVGHSDLKPLGDLIIQCR